jgi:hypothetical protein
MKISELTGAALDYWVAKAEGYVMDRPIDMQMIKGGHRVLVGPQQGDAIRYQYSPSTDWAQGGPIIHKNVIEIKPVRPSGKTWYAIKTIGVPGHIVDGTIDMSKMRVFRGKGITPLEAAMRCFIVGIYGDEVPDEAAA